MQQWVGGNSAEGGGRATVGVGAIAGEGVNKGSKST